MHNKKPRYPSFYFNTRPTSPGLAARIVHHFTHSILVSRHVKGHPLNPASAHCHISSTLFSIYSVSFFFYFHNVYFQIPRLIFTF